MPAGFGTTYNAGTVLALGIPACLAGMVTAYVSRQFELGLATTIGIAALAWVASLVLFMGFCVIVGPVLQSLLPRKVTRCPKCGEPLATSKAQQCLHCGAAWHDQIGGTD